jgi:hypothetical protein
MSNDTNNIDTLTPDENAQNLDAVGSILLSAANGNIKIDATKAAILASLIAQCRIYSVHRDALTDPTSVLIRETEKVLRDRGEANEAQSVSDAADEIMEDLRKSGINI